jgi:uncharacterized protein YbjT (DUF2867 family)
MEVLVTGATGAIGSELIPRLAAAGHVVRALSRDASRVTAHGVARTVEGDASSGAGLDEALKGIDAALYLIHSMETTATVDSNGGFAARDRHAAEHFAAAARRAGVRRLVYLGGIVPAETPVSPHLASRLEVEQTLLEAAPEALALRASIVISARSRSFRFLVRLVERVPVLPLPAWRIHRTAPIDGRDVLAYLQEAVESPAIHGPLSLDIAGRDVLTYAEMIERIRDSLLLSRPSLNLPFSLTSFAGRVAAAIAGEDPELVMPLMGSLSSDLLPRDRRAEALLGVRPRRFAAAVERALGDWEAVEQLAGR